MAEGGGHNKEDLRLQFTPTWIIALVCSGIVLISILVERRLHSLGKLFKKKNQKTLFQALQKVKEELMILGFISLFLTIFQEPLHEICIPRDFYEHMLPCARKMERSEDEIEEAASHQGRSLLEARRAENSHCRRGTMPLISVETIHQLHIFIFVLALTHVIFTMFTMLLGEAKIRQWKYWEDSIRNENSSVPGSVTLMQQLEFTRDRVEGTSKDSHLLYFLHSFGKQFYGSVSKSDYATMRLGFIMTHCKGNPRFDFHKYMVRALEVDFKKVVGISWYLWVFGMIFLLLNISGWHTYFWMAFIPLALLLAVGMKLEHVITQLARDVTEKHSAIHGHLVVRPSDEHFWFKRPRIMLYFIHFILFQNAFEIAFFLWIWITYGFKSCIMDRIDFVIPRLVIGVIIQIVCSYSTLPLYAIVTQMGSSFKKGIFEDHVQATILGWVNQAKKRTSQRVNSQVSRATSDLDARPSMDIQMLQLLSSRRVDSLDSLESFGRRMDSLEEGKTGHRPSGSG